MRKLIVIIVFLVLVRCTVSLVLVKNSDNTDIRHGADSSLDSGLDVNVEPKDTIE